MKLLSILALGAIFALTSINMYAQKVYDISTFGLKPDTHKNASPVLQKALSKIKILMKYVKFRKKFWRLMNRISLKAAMTSMKKELPYANIISRTMTKTILRK